MTNYLVPVTVNQLPQISELEGKQGMFILPDGSININRKNGTWMLINKQSDHAGILKPGDVPIIPSGTAKWYWAGPGTYPNAGGHTIEKQGILSYDGTEWKELELDIPQATQYIPPFLGSAFPIIGPAQRTYNNSIWELSSGNTATLTDIPNDSSTKWMQIGGKVDNVFNEQNQNNGASMNATAKYINERFGVEIEDPGNPNRFVNQADASSNNNYLRVDNTVGVLSTATNYYVVRNIDVAGAYEIEVNGYLLKDGSLSSVGIIGIRPNGSIVNLTESFGDYVQVQAQIFDVSSYDKISIGMASNFSLEIKYSVEYFPKMTEYFTLKEGLSEIFGRRQDRYISTYRGCTVIQTNWETTEFIRVEAGDVIEAEAFGWASLAVNYAFFDKDKNWIKSGDPASGNGAAVSIKVKAEQQGYIIVGNYKLKGAMKVYLNKASKNALEDVNKKIPFIDNKKLDYTTPTSLANARFFEPYIDGSTLKVKLPTTVKDKIVLNDEPHILENRFVGEHSFVHFQGKVLIYYTEAFKTGQDIFDVVGTMSVGMLDEDSEKHTYLQRVIYGGVSGVPEGYNVHRSHAFVKDNQVYIVATVENTDSSFSQIWMFKSSDGFNFTKVKVISNSGFGFVRFGNLWLVTEQVDGYYYFFYEGFTSGIWSVKIARSTTLEGDYTFYQNVTGVNQGGAVGGICVIYYADKFRMWFHYGIGGNLPTWLGYAESNKTTPGTFNSIHQPFLAVDNSPIGPGTDQNGDFALLEINGSIWAGYQYAINAPILNGVFCYKKLNGLTYDKLFN